VLDGSTAFVQKPFNEQHFLRVLRDALQRTAA
jgi:FixJ family two-component response regulator